MKSKVVMSSSSYVKEHRSLINLLRSNSVKLIKEAKKQERELNNWLKKKR